VTICDTHIPAHVPTHDIPRFSNRKGDISQNVLAICTFDLSFSCVVLLWEGSAHDGRVLQWALQHGFWYRRGSTTWLMLGMHYERDFWPHIVEYDIIQENKLYLDFGMHFYNYFSLN